MKNTTEVKEVRSTYFNFHDRELSPLERITQLCVNIRHTDYNFQSSYHIDELSKAYEKADRNTVEIAAMYDEIISLIQLIDIKDYGLLSEILTIISTFHPLLILSNKLSNYTFELSNGKTTNLYDALQQINYNNGIREKYSAYYTEQLTIKRMAEIAILEKRGERICEKKLHDWYRTHIQDFSNYVCMKSGTDYSKTWREKTEYEINTTIYTYPWDNRREMKTHKLKIGMSFGRKQKIEIINITTRNNISVTEYELIGNSYYESDTELIIIEHSGTINDGVRQIFSVSELQEYAENNSIYSILKNIYASDYRYNRHV